ncbi:hypothetical protein GCM10028814_09570 [Angustibacter aerolatus]
MQTGPYWAETPSGFGVVSSSVPPAAVMAAGMPPTSAPREVSTAAAVLELLLPLPEEPEVVPVLQAATSDVTAAAPMQAVAMRRADI